MQPADQQPLVTACSSVLDDPNLLSIIVSQASHSVQQTARVSRLWLQVSLSIIPLAVRHLVRDITSAFAASSIEERGAECIACEAQPDHVRQASCSSCGALVVICGLLPHQQSRWDEFYADADYEGFDAWLLLDNCSRAVH